MVDHFTFDPKTLSDEELYNKHLELGRKRMIATRLNRGEVLNQLDRLIFAIENERRERIFMERFVMPVSPTVIESDPSLRTTPPPEEQAKVAPSKSTRAVRRPVRTTKPQY